MGLNKCQIHNCVENFYTKQKKLNKPLNKTIDFHVIRENMDFWHAYCTLIHGI